MKKLSKKEKKKMRKVLIAKKQESLKISGREYRAKKRKKREAKEIPQSRTKDKNNEYELVEFHTDNGCVYKVPINTYLLESVSNPEFDCFEEARDADEQNEAKRKSYEKIK